MSRVTLLTLVAIWVSSANAADPPNIILMLADDQGWSGLSVPMDSRLSDSKGDVFYTPRLERFAVQGMRFSSGYSAAPVCSPSRISLQTGKSPAALHWTKAAPPEEGHKLLEPRGIKQIPAGEVTIGDLLRVAGYATAHFGKWHIGGGGPERHGYDVSDGDTGNEYAYKFKDPNPVDIFGMSERAAKFMEQSVKTGKPFYVQLSWNALHAPENSLAATLAKYESKMGTSNAKRTALAAMTEDLDTGVGRVLDAVDRLGLSQSTYVIYTSDNGASGNKKALRGGKGDVYEGGVRVPFIIRGPGIAPNSWSETPIISYDLLPTFCDWAGVKTETLPKKLEGGSIATLLRDRGQGHVRRPREELVFHFPHYQGDSPHSAIRIGNFKLLHFYEDQHDELYDLSRDIRERHNLAEEKADQTRDLRQRLQNYLTDVGAQLPTPNPSFDPDKENLVKKRGGKAARPMESSE